MAIAAKEEVMIKIGTGRPPFSIQKLAVLPKDELPAIQQPTSHQPEKRKFFTSTPVLVGGAILLGAFVLVADIYTKKATNESMQNALVMDFEADTIYAGRNSTQLKELAQLCQEYKLSENDMLLITKIAEKVNMAEGEALATIQKNANQLQKPSFDRTGVSGRDGEVLTAFDSLPFDTKDGLLKRIARP